MNKLVKNSILNTIGVVYVLLGFSAVSFSIYFHVPEQIFWFCYFSLFLIGIGILMRNSLLVASQLNIAAIPLIFWTADFFYYLAFQKELFGFSTYFFIYERPSILQLVTLQHIFTLPIALYSLYLMKLDGKGSWKISAIQGTIIFFVVKMLVPSEEINMNCVVKSCFDYPTFWIPYPILWFLAFFLMIGITSFVINRIPFLRKARKTR